MKFIKIWSVFLLNLIINQKSFVIEEGVIFFHKTLFNRYLKVFKHQILFNLMSCSQKMKKLQFFMTDFWEKLPTSVIINYSKTGKQSMISMNLDKFLMLNGGQNNLHQNKLKNCLLNKNIQQDPNFRVKNMRFLHSKKSLKSVYK